MLLVLLIALQFVYMVILPASAQTITMSNPSGTSERDIVVYYPNGTMVGLYNSTSIITIDINESYIFTMVPMRTNLLEDPGDWLFNEAFPLMQSNVIPITFGVFLVGLFYMGRK